MADYSTEQNLRLAQKLLELQGKLNRAEAALSRVRAEHAAIHAAADEFDRTHDPACDCPIATATRAAADQMLAALSAPDHPQPQTAECPHGDPTCTYGSGTCDCAR